MGIYNIKYHVDNFIYSKLNSIFSLIAMEEQRHVSKEKNNAEAEKRNSGDKEKEEFFTISWGVVDQVTPVVNLPSAKSRSADKGHNPARSVHRGSANIAQKTLDVSVLPRIDQEIHKQIIPQHPLYHSQYSQHSPQPPNPFNQSQSLPPHLFSKPTNYLPSLIKPNSFSIQPPIKRTDFIPSQLTHLLTQKQALKYAIQQNSLMGINPGPNRFIDTNEKQNSQDQIKLSIRSQLLRKSRKYQISTNNAHKKYINCLKNLFYEALSQQQINQFERKYIKQKSSRAFFFIILVYVKYRFTKELGNAVRAGFQKQMNERMKQYEEQAYKCSDLSLKNYRREEINEILIALKAIAQFYTGRTAEAIQFLYRKGRRIIVKQNHYRASLKSIQELEVEYSQINEPHISRPFFKDHYHKKIRRDDDGGHELDEKYERFGHMQEYAENYDEAQRNSIGDMAAQEQEEGQGDAEDGQEYGSSVVSDKRLSQKEGQQEQKRVNQMGRVVSKEVESHQNAQQKVVNFQNNPIKPSQNQPLSNPRSQLSSEKLNFLTQRNFSPQLFYHSQNPFPEPAQLPHISQIQELKQFAHKNQNQQILFPPVPPHFYLPDFDEKYGHLFRKLAYEKTWKEMSEREKFEKQMGYGQREGGRQVGKANVPQPLRFATGAMNW